MNVKTGEGKLCNDPNIANEETRMRAGEKQSENDSNGADDASMDNAICIR